MLMDEPTNSQEVTSDENSQDESAEINPKTLLLQTLGTLVVLGIVLSIISTYFKAPVEVWSQQFIRLTGVWGVGLGFLIPDAFTLPIPPDAFLLAGYMGGLAFMQIAISASIGSMTGGTIGFLMIRYLSNTGWAQKRLSKKLKRGESFMRRYGVVALGVAALTPLPYSIICWACGATGMRLSVFLTVSLLRIPRVFAYLWFIEKTLTLT
jgi:membrane protein YqaA with SNARE-associated domain